MNVVQRSMAGGELSPSLYPRTDSAKYGFGLRTLRNTTVKRDGGSRSRPGTKFIAPFRDSSVQGRFIPVQTDGTTGYAIVFESGRFRLYYRGKPLQASLSAAASDITGITNASPGVVTVASASSSGFWANGMEAYIEGVKGMPEINGKVYIISDITATTFQLKDESGTYIDTTNFGTWLSGGTIRPVSQGTHDYSDDEILELDFTQAKVTLSSTLTSIADGAGLIYIAHRDQPVKSLSFGPADGVLIYEATTLGFPYSPSTVDLDSVDPTLVEFSLTAGGAGSNTYRYILTAVLENGEETSPVMRSDDSGSGDWVPSAITKANPAVLTVPDTTGLVDGDLVYITGVRGMKEINGRYFVVDNVAATTFSINADSTSWGTFEVSDDTETAAVYLCSDVDETADVPDVAGPHVLSGIDYPNLNGLRVVGYNIYLNTYGIYGFVGSTSISIFNDIGFDLDASIQPPEVQAFYSHSDDFDDIDDTGDDPLSEVYDNFPGAIGMVQQRLCFGNFVNDKEEIVLSETGRHKSFKQLFPSIASDAFKVQPPHGDRSEIKHIVDSGRMVVLTSSSELTYTGSDGRAVSPSDAFPTRHSSFGANAVKPIVLNGNVIYVQAKGSVLRELFFSVERDGLANSDLTTFSRHLFEGKTISRIAYQSYPNEIIWCLRSDGVLLGLTYVPEQEILAWHRHDFDGTVEDVCVVPETSEDAVYLIMNRTIDGSVIRSVERMYERDYSDIESDAVFMDGSKTFDGRNTDATHTMTLSGGSTWDNTETLTLTSSTSFFVSGDVGNQIFLDLEDADGNRTDRIRFSINAYSSGTVVTGKAHKAVPTGLRSTAIDEWSKAITVLYGLEHLEAEDVAVFADGFVVASPNNSKYSTLTVSSGAITLPKPRAVIHVGLPYISDLEPLDIDTPSGESLVNRGKLVSCVNLHLKNTRGLWVGPRNPDDDEANTGSDLLYNMTEIKPRNTEDMDSPPALKTGIETINISPEWNSNGRVFIRQVDPVPCEVLAITSEGLFEVGE